LLATRPSIGSAPVAFPEAGRRPTKRLEPYLRFAPWQAKKSITFRTRTGKIFSKGKPDFSVKEISKSSKLPTADGTRSFRSTKHNQSFLDKVAQMDEAEIEKCDSDSFYESLHFVLGKSLVGGT